MADGILGLGSDGSLSLNDELIAKLKSAESESVLDPITEDITDKEVEVTQAEELSTLFDEFLELVKPFDLYTSDTNVFDDVVATTSGESVTFDATDTSNLNTGTINVTVNQLAQKDVYQSNLISDITETMSSGTLTITVGDETHEFTTDDKTYEELVEEMGYYSDFEVSLEEVNDDTYRLVVKSATAGTQNGITISQDDIDLGYEDEYNHVLTSQNLLAEIDGIDYDLSSNKVTMDNGLIITALSEGDSSISIEQDSSLIIDSLIEVADKYNELVDLIDKYTLTNDDEDVVTFEDTTTIKMILNSIKNMFFNNYGLEDEENIFKYGITFNDGYIEIDETELSSAVTSNYDDLKELFVGYAEKEGVFTQMKTYLDSLDGLNGIWTNYTDDLDDSLDDLNDYYDEESERLDEKYAQLSEQYAAYTVLITEMENEFASLQAIIDSDS